MQCPEGLFATQIENSAKVEQPTLGFSVTVTVSTGAGRSLSRQCLQPRRRPCQHTRPPNQFGVCGCGSYGKPVETGWDSRASAFQRTLHSSRRFQPALVVRWSARRINSVSAAVAAMGNPLKRVGMPVPVGFNALCVAGVGFNRRWSFAVPPTLPAAPPSPPAHPPAHPPAESIRCLRLRQQTRGNGLGFPCQWVSTHFS